MGHITDVKNLLEGQLLKSARESHVVLSRAEFKRIKRNMWLKGAAIALLMGVWLGYWWRMAQLAQ